MRMRNDEKRRLNLAFLLISAGLFMALTGPVYARPGYVNRVPTPYRCETCHSDPGNRNLRTGFGIDFGLARAVWANHDPMAGICRLDSDGDELTNGEELGDPDCLWRVGDPRPDGPTTNPADPRDPDRCGDGVLQVGEDCDGEDLGALSCEGEGFMDGVLACNANCALDRSACVSFPEPDAGLEPDVGRPDMAVAPMDDAALPMDAAVTSDTQTEDLGAADMSPAIDGPFSSGDVQSESAQDVSTLEPDMAVGELDGDEERSGGSDGGCTAVGSAPAPWLFGVVMLVCVRRRRDRRSVR